MVSMQEELTAVPAIAPENGGNGEWEKAALLLSRLSELGFSEVQRFDAPDKRVPSGKRPNLVVSIPGQSPKPCLWIMSHLDIVPPGDESLWESDPYRVVRKDGLLLGRGVEDNQQGLISSIAAALSLRQLGLKPANTVKLLFVADEETSSAYGIKYLLEHHRLFSKEDMVLVPDGGRPDGDMIEIAEKNLLWLKFQTKGKQCHASMPGEGINAFLAGAELVVKLNELNRLYPDKNPLFHPPNSTFAATKKEANVPNINTIPADDVFYFDCRILPSIDMEEVLARISEICVSVEEKHGVSTTVSTVQRLSSPPTPQDSPLVLSLKRALKRVYAVEGKVCGIGGGTVASFLRQAGIQTVVWAKLDESAHMPNEYCRIENMVGDAKVMACLMLNRG
ncbi:Succinyl-diaminopimelate desuccinylase [subsurface metagenome]